MKLTYKKIASVVVASAIGVAMLGTSAMHAYAAASITMVHNVPQGCQLAGIQISVSGVAIADAPPGQLQQYAAYVDWGDGTLENVITAGAFGSGHGVSDPVNYGPVLHTFNTPGTYTIQAKIYHQNPNGNDNPDAASASTQICIVSPLTVTKTASTSFDRTWTWGIDKVGDQAALNLAQDEVFAANYDVTVSGSSQDSNHMVSGSITIANPLGNPAVTVHAVTDDLSIDADPVVTCPGGLPQAISAGGSLICTYSTAAPGGTQTNAAHVDTSIDVLDTSSNIADVTFGAPTTETDECITVTDDKYGALGLVCGGDLVAGQKLFEYAMNVPSDVCGMSAFTNTASFVTNDTAAEGSDEHTIDVTVACLQGCTLTQGYWKTHNYTFKDGKHADDNWLNAFFGGLKEGKIFYGTTSWYQLFWTPPAGGNVYIQLAHQYMAAKLNVLNGAATTPAVDAALTAAETWFSTKTPSTTLNNAAKNQAKSFASTLGAYNEGVIGPGHCSENQI